MQLLESEWFFRMVEQQGRTPAARLEAIFTVAGQWLTAPGIHEMLATQPPLPFNSRLKSYLTDTAQSARAENPAMLATQLLILLQGAISEELREPGINALQNAVSAARAVIAQACRPTRNQRTLPWSAVASLAIVMTTATLWHLYPQPSTAPVYGTSATARHSPYIQAAAITPTGFSPSEIEQVLNLQEQFNRGTCAAPHLLALPPGQVTAYMDAIHFRTPDNPAADRENLHAFLVWFNTTRASECYYPPANGHTLVTWR